MNNLELYMFWTQHADAVGVALFLTAAFVLLFVLQDRAHCKQQAAQRKTDAALRAKDRADLHSRYAAIIRHLTKRPKTLEEQVTEAIAQTRPDGRRTPLADSHVDAAVDGPVFWDGVNR